MGRRVNASLCHSDFLRRNRFSRLATCCGSGGNANNVIGLNRHHVLAGECVVEDSASRLALYASPMPTHHYIASHWRAINPAQLTLIGKQD